MISSGVVAPLQSDKTKVYLKMKKTIFLLLFLSSCGSLYKPDMKAFYEKQNEIQKQKEKENNQKGVSSSSQCFGTTQKGLRCKNITKDRSGLCYIHKK
jgi:hypothetical protein